MEIQLAILITLFTIQLGPLKVIGPFAVATKNADPALRREIALRSTLAATGISLLIALVGGYLMSRLNLSFSTLAITMAVFLGHWAIGNALAPVGGLPESPEAPTKELALIPIATPALVPAQGVALLVIVGELEFETNALSGLLIVIGLVVGINLLNLIFMLGVRYLMVFPGLMFWQVLGRLLAVVVFAIAIQIGVAGLRGYGIVP